MATYCPIAQVSLGTLHEPEPESYIQVRCLPQHGANLAWVSTDRDDNRTLLLRRLLARVKGLERQDGLGLRVKSLRILLMRNTSPCISPLIPQQPLPTASAAVPSVMSCFHCRTRTVLEQLLVRPKQMLVHTKANIRRVL